MNRLGTAPEISWMVIAWVSSRFATLIAVTDTGVVSNDSLRWRAVTMISSKPLSGATVAGGAATCPHAQPPLSDVIVNNNNAAARGVRDRPVWASAHGFKYDTSDSPLL